MTPEKIIQVVEVYERWLRDRKVPKMRLDPDRSFKSASEKEILAHAHYLIDGVKAYARDPEKLGKTNRHLTAIQMCLSFAGVYTLQELMDHNRP